MKSLIKVLIPLLIISAPRAFADDDFTPRLVTAPVERIFVPLGFDNNDNVEIILHGHYPSACYKLGPALYEIDEATRQVKIEALAYQYNGDCAEISIPFMQTISVGIVKEGDYTVSVKDRPYVAEKSLFVTEATTSLPDDYLYAPVSTVEVVNLPTLKKAIRLTGEFPRLGRGCMVLKEVRVNVTSDNVIIVLPIAEVETAAAVCSSEEYSTKFDVQKVIPGELWPEDYLIHVRVAAGGAINRFFTME